MIFVWVFEWKRIFSFVQHSSCFQFFLYVLDWGVSRYLVPSFFLTVLVISRRWMVGIMVSHVFRVDYTPRTNSIRLYFLFGSIRGKKSFIKKMTWCNHSIINNWKQRFNAISYCLLFLFFKHFFLHHSFSSSISFFILLFWL